MRYSGADADALESVHEGSPPPIFLKRSLLVHATRNALTFVFIGFLLTASAAAQWVDFNDQTSSRMVAATSLGSGDTQEKDYAWGDLDQDGDVDLVCVRKQPWTTTGRFPNVLFMNENGVLTDRTSALASSSSVAGSQGFLDDTNDRDVAIADIDGDGWLDVVTATTLSGTEPKYISHPRIYLNLGNDAGGNWQGLHFDDENRAPTMPDEPRFCSVSTGDLDGDGDIDLYLGDYQQGGTRAIDLNDRLWINDGTGYFTDESSARMTAEMLESSFAMATAIEDMNGDGKLDILKDDALNSPQGVSISYNDGASHGYFATYEVVHNAAPYHIAVGDLNNDNLPDIVVTDDGDDRYRLNTGNGANGLATFAPSQTFSFTGGGADDGFGGNNLIIDLNNDGWNDVLITDVDVDISGTSRRTHIYRNLGNAPSVTLQEETLNGEVVGIPIAQLRGTHDIAVFDINGDGWNDMVVGRSVGTSVWMNIPPTGLVFSYPSGLPYYRSPGLATILDVDIASSGGSGVDPSSVQLHQRINGGAYATSSMATLGGGRFRGTLAALPNCLDTMDFYITAQTVGGAAASDPPTAPANAYGAVAATGSTITLDEHFEGTVTGWTVISDASLTTGAWEVATPEGTLYSGSQAAPAVDADASAQSTQCYVTQNGPPGGSSGIADVDGGPTHLISPALNLQGADATVSYARWVFSSGFDVLDVSVTGDGTNWTIVESVGGNDPVTGAPANDWTVHAFKVSDFIAPTATVQVRFTISDNPNDSITEAAIDAFTVQELQCTVPVYCQSNIGMQGPGSATMSICGGNLTPGTSAALKVESAVPNAQAFLLVATALAPLPVFSGTAINSNPIRLLPFITDGVGEWGIPNIPGGGGVQIFYLQAAQLSSTLPSGLGFTNGVRLIFLP